MDTIELLLHPVRLRIVQAFLGNRTLTTSALGGELDDIPPGSLYRHITRLVDAGILEVTTQRRIRGTVERTYRLRLDATRIEPAELADMSTEGHRRAFMAYIAGLIADFDRYLAHDDIDYVRDGVGYRTAGLWLDATEFAEFVTELGEVITRRLANTPTPGRERHILRVIHIPADTPDPISPPTDD